jgi:hypothetical protein
MQGIILCTKRLLIVCLLLVSGASQASTSLQNRQDGTIHSPVQIQTVSDHHLAKIRAVPRPNATKFLPKVKRQQQALLTRFADDDDNDNDFSELDAQVGYRRPKLTEENSEDESVSPYVADRLAQARELALAKYKEVWQ